MTERLQRMQSGCGKGPETREALDAAVKNSDAIQDAGRGKVPFSPTVLSANPIHPPDPDQGLSTL